MLKWWFLFPKSLKGSQKCCCSAASEREQVGSETVCLPQQRIAVENQKHLLVFPQKEKNKKRHILGRHTNIEHRQEGRRRRKRYHTNIPRIPERKTTTMKSAVLMTSSREEGTFLVWRQITKVTWRGTMAIGYKT